MSKKHLVVFGGSGWLGSTICARAAAAGWEVTAISRSGQAPSNFPDAWKVQWMACDALNRDAVQDVLTKVPGPVDAVISCIGLLTLDRPKAIVMNGQTNTNIIASIYNRQQMILHDRALDEAEGGKDSSSSSSSSPSTSPSAAVGQKQQQQRQKQPEAKSAEKKPAAAVDDTTAGSSDVLVKEPRDTAVNTQEERSELHLRDDTDYNEPGRAAPNTALLTRERSELAYSPFAIRKGERCQLPPLTEHKSGLPRIIYISAANFGWPINKFLRGYFDGKIAAERACLEHVKERGAVLRPGAIHGVRRVNNIPVPLSPFFFPMELGFPFWQKLTGLGILQPPSHIGAVADAALAAVSMEGLSTDESLLKLAVKPQYGYSKGGIIGYAPHVKPVDRVCPIFEYDGIQALARAWRKSTKK